MSEAETTQHFVQQAIAEDRRAGRFDGRVHTRFPPGATHIFTADEQVLRTT